MTKTLTEQWRDGTLPRGGYYIKLLDGSIKQTNYDNISNVFDTELFQYSVSVKEVLAPVPNYQEFVQQRDFVKDHMKVLIENMNLKRKLEIATKALEEMVGYPPTNFNDCETYMWSAQQALKEMEGVK